jgi:hypothetical protein
MAVDARAWQPSHLGQPSSDVRLSIPIHGSQPLKLVLLKHLLKMAGLSEKETN